jgi:hypothetical protein
MTAQKKLLAEKNIQALIAKCKEALALYEAKALMYGDQLHPEGTAERLRKEITATQSIEEALKFQTRLAKFLSDDARLLGHTLRQHLIREFNEVKVLLIDLASESLRLLTAYRESVIQSERDFFAAHGLPHQPTAVSTQFDSARRELEWLRDSLLPQKNPRVHAMLPNGPLPDARATLLTWFGIQDIV